MASNQKMKVFDLYRKIPTDLTEATTVGGALSLFAAALMFFLFTTETISFMQHTTETMVVLDPGREQQIRINFNITLLDLPCRYAVVDVLDVLGTNTMNVSKNIEKWNLDESGRRRFFQGRNREEREIVHEEGQPELEVLLQNGEHAVPLMSETFGEYLKNNEYIFVNFFAPWCVWCQRLHPTWEAFAENVEKENIAVKVVKVDCVANADICAQQKIHAFPTLRLFRHETPLPPDYNTDRTVQALTSYVTRKLNVEDKRKNWPDRDREYQEHPGCMLSGYLLVNKVPGNFHLEARSKSHNLNSAMTNLSHVVNHLSFGPPMSSHHAKKLDRFSSEFHVQSTLDGQIFILNHFHKAYHHYIKVVPTMYDVGRGGYTGKQVDSYQMLSQSSVMTYDDNDIPEARFNYDISPMSVIVKRTGRRWYEFVTSLCGILGGTFQVFGLLDGILEKAGGRSKHLVTSSTPR